MTFKEVEQMKKKCQYLSNELKEMEAELIKHRRLEDATALARAALLLLSIARRTK